MSDLSVKNFAVFKDSTSFTLKPLTFLIGANGSGKSSLLKLLNLIEYDLRFHKADKFDLANFSFQIQNSKKPLDITYCVANGLHRHLRIIVRKENWTLRQDDYVSYSEIPVVYLNDEGESVLSTKPTLVSDSIRGVNISIDIPKLYDILDINGAMEFKNKLLVSSIPEKKITLNLVPPNIGYNDNYFESWLFSAGLYEFFSKSSLDNLIVSSAEISENLLPLFKPSFYLNNERVKFSAREKATTIELEIIRLNDLGEPKRVFLPDDNFSKTLNEIENYIEPGYDDVGAKDFLNKWIKKFFGEDATFTYKRSEKDFSFYSAKLNGKYLTEHGTGVFRMIHMICKLCSFYYNEELFKYSPSHILRTNNQPFIKRRFLILEEPETNLHPDFQVFLAEMLFDLMKNSLCYIIVETHSEYMVRMLQYLVAKNEGSNELVGLINFGTDKDAGKVKHISIHPNGSLSDNFFSGFFNYSEDLRLMLDALNNKRNN
jgi:predicted ATP-dependent endonuclease of OLD family